MIVYPEGSFYSMVQPDDIPEIVSEHLLKAVLLPRLLYQETVQEDSVKSLNETDFYKKQVRVALRNCGVINPENIDEYIAVDGYAALGKVLTEMTPDDVIQVIKDSGLRGRGGAGFPTGTKWSFAKASKSDQKYVCCNADEGTLDRVFGPFRFGRRPPCGAGGHGHCRLCHWRQPGIYLCPCRVPHCGKTLEIAIAQAREYGLLGKNIFDSGFDFDIDIRLGAGAFVCGEETALMTSIEGNRGEPRPRPPFPAVKGLFQQPTILNNVETYANIAQIILKGADWFASMGTEKSKGTKVFALGGKIHNTGLVEIPMGTTLRKSLRKSAAVSPAAKNSRRPDRRSFRRLYPASHYDVPIDYDNLIAIGSMMGSGGLIVMDEDNCMVDIAKFFLEFTVDESCGKCTPCRIGTKRLYEMLDKITRGTATMEDLDKMEKLCYYIKENALCGLGQTAPNPRPLYPAVFPG